MRYREYSREEESANTHSSLFIICFLCVFLCAAALGTLRLYGLYREHRISETANKIEMCKEENMVMARHYSELLSPARIYSYARENLSMNNEAEAQTIHVDQHAVLVAKASVNPQENTNAGLLDYFNPFVKKAHAKN